MQRPERRGFEADRIRWFTVALVAVFFAGMLAVPIAADDATPAQDDATVEEPPTAEPPSPGPAPVDQTFDTVVFGGHSPDAASMVRGRLQRNLRRKLALLGRVCDLSVAQKEKLDRAGRGDIKRLFEQVEEQRTKFKDAGAVTAMAVKRLASDTADLRFALRTGPFGDESWFEKALRRTLSPEQIEKYDRRPLLASASTKRISVDNAIELEIIAKLETEAHELVWNRDGTLLGLVKFDDCVVVYRPAEDRPIRTVGDGHRVIGFDFGPQEKFVAMAENSRNAMVFDGEKGKEFTFPAGTARPHVKFSPDGTTLVTGGYGTTAKLWSTATGKRLREFDTGVEGGLTPAFSPDGTILAVGNRNGKTHLFEVSTGRLLHVLDREMSHQLKFDPIGKALAVVYVDGTLTLWDPATGREVKSVQANADELYAVDWSPDGRVLVTAGLRSLVTLWNAHDLSIVNELESPEWVVDAKFNPDGTMLVFAGGATSNRSSRRVETWAVP
jgi:hypothetical protein